MAKDPAINWYFDNWGGGTKTMSRFLKGCYIDLLDAQFHSGHLSLDEIKIVLGADFSTWNALSKKFAVDEAGKYFNERLDHEILKRLKFTEKQSLNGSKGGRPIKPKENPNINPNKSLYETGIETEIKNGFLGKLENPLKTTPKKEDVERVFLQQGGTKDQALYFFNQYEAVHWKLKGMDIKNFSTLAGNFISNWNANKNGNNANNKINARDSQASATERMANKLKDVIGRG